MRVRLNLVLLAVLAAGCGLAPQDSFPGQRSGDGVAPWENLGPLPLCLSNRRLGPPASDTGGFCASGEDLAERACLSDGDCRSRERCVCNRCAVQFCTSNQECGRELVCNFGRRRCDRPCQTDDDCPDPDEQCRAGVCQGLCGSDADCQAGEVCNSLGRCIVDACQTDMDCREGEVCRLQREPALVAEPTVVVDPDAEPPFTMFFEMANPGDTVRSIWRAVSADGIIYRVDPVRPVVEDGATARAPSVVVVGDVWRIYYEAQGGIASAESVDRGVDFGPSSLVIPGDLHAPAAVVLPDGEVAVYMEIGDGTGIGLWRGGGAPVPVLVPGQVTDPSGWRSVSDVGSPFVLLESSPLGEPTVRLWFEAVGVESDPAEVLGETRTNPPNHYIGFASTPAGAPDAFALWPYNPVFDRPVAFLEHRSEKSPAVARVPGQPVYYLYYAGASADETEDEGLGIAVNPGSF